MRSSVDLPHPDGPSKTRNSPMSRPSREYASSTLNLMSCTASIRFPSGERKQRLTLRTVILDFLGSMFHRLQMGAGAGDSSTRSRETRSRSAPWKSAMLQESKLESEQEGSNTDGDDASVHALEIHN